MSFPKPNSSSSAYEDFKTFLCVVCYSQKFNLYNFFVLAKLVGTPTGVRNCDGMRMDLKKPSSNTDFSFINFAERFIPKCTPGMLARAVQLEVSTAFVFDFQFEEYLICRV